MNSQEQWKLIIRNHFGKRASRRWRELMMDLLCVDHGVKPALLFDYSTPDVTVMYTFLRNLKESSLLQCPNLRIVVIDMDLLLINLKCFADATGERTGLTDMVSKHFIDITPTLSQPQIITDNRKLLQHTLDCFQRCVDKQSPFGADSIVWNLDRNELVNPSTLFGLFLGYPVVYWYDMADGCEQSRLSLVPLLNFVLKGVITLTATNIGSIEHQGESGQQNKKTCVHEHIITSFSVPEHLAEIISESVEVWFEGIKTKRLSWSSLFDDLQLEKRVMQMPTLCL
ncbi:UPF0739 protein C1orf74 homolog [Pomacea canaliculata]|nr:UPF0739 protein C1orf74 homolog [Pomacea canaliculata]